MRTCYVMRYASAAVLWVSAVTTAPAGAQIMASERAMVAQTVDGTRLTVDYSRPRARGRTNIYGGMEKWGITWTPGADDATTLELSKPVQLLGMTVPRGKYSVWLVLREQGPWTFVLDPRDSLFHTDHPDSTAQQWRAPVMPMRVPHSTRLRERRQFLLRHRRGTACGRNTDFRDVGRCDGGCTVAKAATNVGQHFGHLIVRHGHAGAVGHHRAVVRGAGDGELALHAVQEDGNWSRGTAGDPFRSGQGWKGAG